MGTKKSEHQSSLLLSQEANDKIFSLLEPKTHAVSTALVGVVISKPPKHPEWKHLRNGIATLTKDYTRKAYFIQIYDIVDWERLREEELKKGTIYHASMPKFHQFEAGKGQTMGLKFASEDEARRFAQVARAIVMTGQYKTDGCPMPPEVKDGNEQPPEHQEKNGNGEIKPEKQRGSLSSPPPPPPGNRSSLLAPPPPPPANKEDSPSSPSSSPSPVARDTSQAKVSSNKQSMPQRPHSMPPTSTSAQNNNADPNSTDKKRPKSKRLTKDMIGEPTDFKHVYHLGFNSSEPVDEKALQKVAGSRPPAPSRPPPPPPPGKKSESGKTSAAEERTDQLSAVHQASGGDSSISSSVNPAGSKGQDDRFSTLIPNVATATAEDSFASDLIEEYLRRSNLTSDEQEETQNAANEVSVLSAENQDITEDANNTLPEADIELMNPENDTENDMSQIKAPDEETQSVTPETTSAVASSSDIISKEDAAKDSLLESGTVPSNAEKDNTPKDKAEDVEIQSSNPLIESGETSLENNLEITNSEAISEELGESTDSEQSPEESSNEQQNDEDEECTSQDSTDEKQSDNKECPIQEPTVDQQNAELPVACSEGNHPNEPIPSDVPKVPTRHRKKQPKRLVTPPPTPPSTPIEAEPSTLS